MYGGDDWIVPEVSTNTDTDTWTTYGGVSTGYVIKSGLTVKTGATTVDLVLTSNEENYWEVGTVVAVN